MSPFPAIATLLVRWLITPSGVRNCLPIFSRLFFLLLSFFLGILASILSRSLFLFLFLFYSHPFGLLNSHIKAQIRTKSCYNKHKESASCKFREPRYRYSFIKPQQMDVETALHMKEGLGEASYAQNSSIQVGKHASWGKKKKKKKHNPF